jgi:signal transduction histidine kinase
MAVPAVSISLFLHASLSLLTILLLGGLTIWVLHNGGKITGRRIFVFLLGLAILWQLHLLPTFFVANAEALKYLSFGEKFVGFVASLVWFVFVSQYTNNDFHRRWWVQSVLVGELLLLAIPILYSPIRTSLVAGFEIHRGGPFSYAALERGPLYFLALVIVYAFVVAGVVLLVQFLLRTRRNAWPRIVLLIAGATAVGTLNNLSVFGHAPLPGFNYGGYGVLPFAVATTIAVVRFRLLDIIPIARNTLVESLDDAVLVVDEGCQLTDYNRQATVLQPAVQDAEGDQLTVVWPALAEQLDLPITEARDTQIVLEIGGQTRHFSLVISPVRKSTVEQPLGYSLFLRDITELEASRQQLSEQNRRLDQVASTVSHDLRNPLNVAQGYVTQLDAHVDEEAQPYLEQVEGSIDRMNAIIDDVLLLARENSTVSRTEVGIASVANSAWENVETDGASLVVEGDGLLRADRNKLLRVFENLFRNAVEHGIDREYGSDPLPADETRLTVSVTVLDDGFAVADDGPGIPADKRTNVFEFGYTTSDSGTGFGLSIVKQLIEVHDWTVQLDPDHDGARFVVSGVEFVDPKTPETDQSAGSTTWSR